MSEELATIPPKNEGFINETGLDFSDISSETEREYIHFVNGNLKIDGTPLYLNVKQKPTGDTHRLYTSTGWCYYIAPAHGYAIRWKVQEGKPSFVK